MTSGSAETPIPMKANPICMTFSCIGQIKFSNTRPVPQHDRRAGDPIPHIYITCGWLATIRE
jgi:hypothetical protein